MMAGDEEEEEERWELLKMPHLIPIESRQTINEGSAAQVEMMPMGDQSTTRISADGLIIEITKDNNSNHKCKHPNCPRPFKCHLCNKCYPTRGTISFLTI